MSAQFSRRGRQCDAFADELLQKRINCSPDWNYLKDTETPMPKVKIADMREELKAGNRSLFLKFLQTALQITLTGKSRFVS